MTVDLLLENYDFFEQTKCFYKFIANHATELLNIALDENYFKIYV